MENVKFKKLEKLNLGSNKITNFNVLENVNFNELKELDLSNNKISDNNIKRFEKIKKIRFYDFP